ncbi:TRAP transporter small permease subunit [Chthonobacter rhizosphaerae]|uniref:TRAP transporter small permease subunit n=1 Tax=Chthonobacter rhizosphaerae TaxID=2735553 RepID=UPI0015EF2626|nr:TRAP transporter small permease subunit [Chthonobacter rhizosphaerae]
MGAITRWIETVNQSVGNWSSLVYLVVFAVTVYDVAARYFFNAPTIWGLELVIALAGIHYMLAGAAAVKNDAHVRIDFIYRLLSPRTQLVMTLLAHLLSLLFLGAIVYYGIQQAETSFMGGERTGAGWNSRAPMWMKLAIPVGAALMVLQILINFARTFRELRRVR